MDEDIARKCRVFDHIHVSLDGIGDVYRAMRGVDGFERVDNAIKLLRKKRIKLGVNCVVTSVNYDGLEDLVIYLRRVGVRDILFLRLKPVSRALMNYDQLKLTPYQRRAFYQKFSELTQRYRLQSYVDCSMLPFFFYHNSDKRKMAFTGGDGCNGANEIVEILPDGRVQGCSFVHAHWEQGHVVLELGSMATNPIAMLRR